MTIEAGNLRRRIALLQPVDTANNNGGSSRSWQTVTGCASVPARMTYPPPAKKGDEQYTQQQVHSSVFVTITIRYRPSLNVNAAMRVQYGTKIFEIRTVIVADEYPQEVTMQCEELQGRGTLHS